MLMHSPKQCEGGRRKSSLCHEKVVCKVGNLGPGGRKPVPSPAAAAMYLGRSGRWGGGGGVRNRLPNSTLSPVGLSGARLDSRIPRVDVSWHFRKLRHDLKLHQEEEYSFKVLRFDGIRIIPVNAAYPSIHDHVIGPYVTSRHPGQAEEAVGLHRPMSATSGDVPTP